MPFNWQVEIFALFQKFRASIQRWCEQNPAECNEVMEAVVKAVVLKVDNHSGEITSGRIRAWVQIPTVQGKY